MADLVSLTVFRKAHLPRVPKRTVGRCDLQTLKLYYNELIQLLLHYNYCIYHVL